MSTRVIDNWDTILDYILEGSSTWESLIINRRKPVTYRLWRMLPDGNRVCLHKFLPCHENEAFAHPHGWGAEFVVLEGRYVEDIWYGNSPKCLTQQPVCSTVHARGSWHEIDNPWTWHKIVPQVQTFTVMVNGPAYDNSLPSVKTTKGKDLLRMGDDDKKALLQTFDIMMGASQREKCTTVKEA